MAVKYYLETRPNRSTEEQAIRASISIRGVRYVSTIGITIRPETWDQAGQRVLPSFKTVNSKGATPKIINSRLKAIKSHFDDKEVRSTGRPSKEEIKSELYEITGSERQASSTPEEKHVLDRFEEFVLEESRTSQWTDGTLQCWNAFKRHLTALGDRLRFDYFNERGIQRFLDHLRTACQMEENTVRKQYGYLKWFLRWAIRKGYCTETSIERFAPKFRVLEKPIIFLTADELQRLYFYEIPENGTEVILKNLSGEEYTKTVQNAAALEKTRDLFCFCALTSLRYSDMAKLKRTDISGDLLYTTTQKTNDRLVINLNTFAKAILDKYKDEQYPEDLALPVISNQKMNDYLKDLCELCGFADPITSVSFKGGARTETTRMKWELIGTHAARRTFISYAIAKGTPPETVMKWTGHSDYKSMKPYIDIAEKEKEAAMTAIDEELQIILNDEKARETTERA